MRRVGVGGSCRVSVNLVSEGDLEVKCRHKGERVGEAHPCDATSLRRTQNETLFFFSSKFLFLDLMK